MSLSKKRGVHYRVKKDNPFKEERNGVKDLRVGEIYPAVIF